MCTIGYKLFTGVYFVLVTMRVESVWMTMQKTPEFIVIGLVKWCVDIN